MKKLFAVIILLCTIFLSSCGILKELKAGMDDAMILVENFCIALADDDLDGAKEYLHSNSTPSKDGLASFVLKLEQTNNIDFSDGVAFKRRTAAASTYYDSKYDGSVHEITYTMVISKKTIDFFFVVVSNDNGYGIYNFGVE